MVKRDALKPVYVGYLTAKSDEYKVDVNFVEKAPLMVAVLIDCAIRRRTITYQDMARRIGTADSGNQLGFQLMRVMDVVVRYCNLNRLPLLTCLIVKKSTGRPSHGFFPVAEFVHPSLKGLEDSRIVDVVQEMAFDRYAVAPISIG